MKKLYLFVLVICLTLPILGCSSKTVYACLSFSKYYQGVDNFDEISTQLELYFSLIETAYENSNKKKLSSFVLSEEYDEVRDTLQSFYDALKEKRESITQIEDDTSYALAEESYISELKLLSPYIQIESMIAEQKLMLQTSPHTKDEEWFNELNTVIKDSVREYLMGTEE